MIPRYTRPEMAAIWSPETKFRIWFEIEAHAASAQAELGVIPRASAEAIWAKGGSADTLGFRAAMILYMATGILFTLILAIAWRKSLLPRDAIGNSS